MLQSAGQKAVNMSERTSLVDFQRAIFAQIEAFQQRGDERLCLRAVSGKQHWAMDANDILHVAQMPKTLPFIPAAPVYVKGLLQQDGDVFTVFDLGHILSGVPTPLSKSNRVLIIQPAMMAGVALLVEKAYSLISMESMHIDKNNVSVEYSAAVLKIEESDTLWHWLNFQTLLNSPSFATRRLDIKAK